MKSKSNIIYLGLSAIPALIFILAGFFIIPIRADFIRESCNFLIITGFVYCLVFLFPSRLKGGLSFFAALILSLLCLIKLSFYHLYHTKLTASALFVIFETNAGETASFLHTYLNGTVIFFVLLFTAYLIAYGIRIWKKNTVFRLSILRKYVFVSKLFFLMGAIVCGYLIHWKFSDYNLLYKTKTSFEEYQAAKKLIRKSLAKPTSDFLNEVKASENSPKIAVVIIGESTSREHMGLYEYNRKNNPLLTEMRDELIVAKDVITPHVHTITALQKILTLKSTSHPDLQHNASIIQLANEAGYKTYWLSNQQPTGFFSSIPTLIGYAADEKDFLNTNAYNRISYDEVLLPALDKALTDNSTGKKMIFLHLMGTHLGYAERYPKKFDYFKDRPKTDYPNEKAFHLINAYDNAVLYNDFIVKEIIERVRSENTSSYVLYFSDHGDDVFDNQNNAGHNEYTATDPMYEVPFVVWRSKAYQKEVALKVPRAIIENRKYLLDDFIYSFADLMQIQFDGYDASKSIFSEAFKPKPRIIKDSIDYDLR